jgi:ATP-dependent DNA ligase
MDFMSLKLDGYRAIAVKSGGKVTVYSRDGTDLTQRFRYVADAVASLPDETVIDGERDACLREESRARKSHRQRLERPGLWLFEKLRPSRS